MQVKTFLCECVLGTKFEILFEKVMKSFDIKLLSLLKEIKLQTSQQCKANSKNLKISKKKSFIFIVHQRPTFFPSSSAKATNFIFSLLCKHFYDDDATTIFLLSSRIYFASSASHTFALIIIIFLSLHSKESLASRTRGWE